MGIGTILRIGSIIAGLMILLLGSVLIASGEIEIDMGTLLEGDGNSNDTVNVDDFTDLLDSYLESTGDPAFNPQADYDRSGTVNVDDFTMLLDNYLKSSPQEI